MSEQLVMFQDCEPTLSLSDSLAKICRLLENGQQGFPDDWTKYGANGKKMNDSARYKACGNAVSVCWPEWIGRKLLES